MARLAGVVCPFMIQSNIPLPIVGFILLFIHAVTVISVYHVPETNGQEMGHALDVKENNPDTATVAQELIEVPPIS